MPAQRRPRGPGLETGLRALERVRDATGLLAAHRCARAGTGRAAAEVVDALQIPAFLCRQTDLLLAAGATGLPVNVKKGQWMAPEEMAGAVEKVRKGGSQDIAVTERGTAFGYGDLIVDMRSFGRLRPRDGSHRSVRRDSCGAARGAGSQRRQRWRSRSVPALLLAAAAAGADGFFLETHPDPARAASDAATQWPLDRLSDS